MVSELFLSFSGFYSWLQAQTVYIEPVAFQQAAVRSLHGLNSTFLPFLKDSVPGKAAADEPQFFRSPAADLSIPPRARHILPGTSPLSAFPAFLHTDSFPWEDTSRLRPAPGQN